MTKINLWAKDLGLAYNTMSSHDELFYQVASWRYIPDDVHFEIWPVNETLTMRHGPVIVNTRHEIWPQCDHDLRVTNLGLARDTPLNHGEQICHILKSFMHGQIIWHISHVWLWPLNYVHRSCMQHQPIMVNRYIKWFWLPQDMSKIWSRRQLCQALTKTDLPTINSTVLFNIKRKKWIYHCLQVVDKEISPPCREISSKNEAQQSS